jgi:hypothetical protein
MKIRVNPFDKASVNEALKQIRRYKRDFEKKEREFIRRVAELGVSVAQTGFSQAVYDGDKDVTVALIKTDSGYSIVASGETVGFIEFGTGIRNREWNNVGMSYTPPRHGTYGKGRGANPKGWYYAPGHHTYGHVPAEAMRNARDEMVVKVIQIAREVFG